jgi:hypothetical protein
MRIKIGELNPKKRIHRKDKGKEKRWGWNGTERL